jgi:hypothetical protein
VEVALGCEWCLDQNNYQGWFGECFVQALAAAAGLQCSPLTPDCTGVDFDLSSPREIDGDFPCVKVQVKSWSVPKESGESWRYTGLTQKRFNALAGVRRIPRFLFLVVVPPDVNMYAWADQDVLRLSHAAYWISLQDQEQFAAPVCERKIPLLIPKRNLLTAQSLKALCEDVVLADRGVS